MINSDKKISSVEATAITGVKSCRSVDHILTGRVCSSGLAIMTLITTSSQDTKKANNAPAKMPGLIAGKVTLKMACSLCAPQITAAFSTDLSNSLSELMMEIIAKGMATITWLITNATMVPVSPKLKNML